MPVAFDDLIPKTAVKRQPVSFDDLIPSGDKASETGFRDWYAGVSRQTGLDPNPDAPEHRYDYRAAYQSGIRAPDASGHWPSKFKASDHPNRYVNGVDTITGAYVPPELLQAEEQQAIERAAGSYPLPDWLKPTTQRFPAPNGGEPKSLSDLMSGRYGRDVSIPKNIHVPRMAEAGAIPAEAFKAYITNLAPTPIGPLGPVLTLAEQIAPESRVPKTARGAIEGASDALAGFTTPENLSTLAIMPQSKMAQVLLNLGFGAEAVRHLPEQIRAYGATDDPAEKARIATGIGVSIGAPIVGVTHAALRKPGPKIVEPVRTTQETLRDAAEAERQGTTEIPTGPDSSAVSRSEAARPITGASEFTADIPPIPPRSQPEPIPPRPSEASPKTPAQMTPEEWRAAHFDENEHRYLPSDYLAQHVFDAKREVTDHIKTVNGIEFRKDKYGSVFAFDGERNVGYGDGKAFVVAPEYQKRGIGTELISITKANDPLKPIGSKTAAGDALIQAYHRRLIKESQPIEPGIEAAIAEIQKRNAPAARDQPITPNILSEEALQSRQPLPETSLRRSADAQPESIPTSTKNATTFAERERAGLPEAEQAARRDFGTVWDEAEAVAKADVEAPRRLVAEISENPRALTDRENALLLRRQIEVQNEHAAAIEAVNSAPGDTAALSRLETARNELQTVYDAAKSAGTETGRGLNARKMLANHDFSLAKMEAETRAVVNEGKPLSPKQANEVRNLHARIAQAEAKVAAYEARETFNSELRQARKAGVRPDTFLDQQAQKARERIIARRGKLFADPIGVTQIAHLADEAIIGAAHIARGVRNFGDWSKTMISEFGERIKPYLQALYQKAQSLHSETAKRAVVSPEERLSRALEGDKSRIRTNIAKIEAKTAAGEFEPAPKNPPRMDKEKANLLFEYQKAKEAYTRGLFQAKLNKQSAPRKALRYGGEVLNTMRALMTSFDLSAVLRQGGFVTLGHPLRAAKSLPAMFRAFASEKAQFRINEEIRNRPNAPLYRQSKLYLADESVNSLSKMEEAYMSRWASKIPIVSGSQRAYTTFLNKLRADSFDTMVETLGRRGRVTTPEAQAIANFVNVATGRGNMGGAAQAAVGLNTVFFAPRYVLSRFQLLAGQPLYGGSLRTRVAIAKEYGRMLTGLAAIYTLAKSAGAEVESDSRSSDFGKLRFGDTRVDPLFGLAQSTVLLSRLGSGETKNLKGKILPIRGDKVPYGSGNSADVIARFLRTKLSPSFGGAVDIMAGKNVIGEPATPLSTATKMVVPLSFGDIYNAMKDQGVEKGTAFAMLAMFGMGVQHYSPRAAKPKSERRKTLEEAMAELRQGKIKEFLTGK